MKNVLCGVLTGHELTRYGGYGVLSCECGANITSMENSDGVHRNQHVYLTRCLAVGLIAFGVAMLATTVAFCGLLKLSN